MQQSNKRVDLYCQDIRALHPAGRSQLLLISPHVTQHYCGYGGDFSNLIRCK